MSSRSDARGARRTPGGAPAEHPAQPSAALPHPRAFFFNPKFPRERPLSISFLSLGVFDFFLEN